ncbi:hypothetical protein ABT052_28905 [Streptomyces sp. NPDC002766]|uniref:hypothetical protein n=1 Tax=Streptomyces sp. NPDC002766 TaxID=3154429 RepID=UPI00332AEFF4
MIQHMNLVFQAEGLNTGQFAFLMACANHTDDRGYVIAHMQQIADEAHMALRTAQAKRAELEKRNLLKAAPRYSPKNGAQIANLFRINLDLLQSMKRARKDYGPSLVEELTFDAPDENRRSDPHAESAPPPADLAGDGGAGSAPPPAESAPPPADLAGDGGAGSAPLLLPSTSPSSLSLTAQRGEGPSSVPSDGERENEASPANSNNPSGAELPQQREKPAEYAAGERIVAAYTAALGRPVLNGTKAKLERQAVELLAQGLPEAWLCDRVREMAARGWSNLAQHAERSTAPIALERPGHCRPGLPEWCGQCGEGSPAARLNARFRTLGELGSGEKCPRCHPDRAVAAVTEQGVPAQL